MTAIAEAKTIVPARKFAKGASFFRQGLNSLLAIDLYKADHRRQYLIGGKVTRVLANWTNRKSRLKGIDCGIHFGLQSWIQEYNDGLKAFFAADVDEVCAEYERRLTLALGPNDIGSEHIRALHNLGYLPLRFCAVPEGTLVPIGVPSFTIENTIDEFYWLTNYVESALSSAIWQVSTSATKAWHLRQMLNRWAMHTGTPIESVDWQAHDFSFRGMPGWEAASASSAGHLLSFKGSDTLIAMDWIDYYYPGSPDDEVILASIPATEHSVMCTGIAKIGEQEVFNGLLDLYKEGPFSAVADSFNLFEVIEKILPALKEKIERRDGKLIIRPDSGDPVKIVCGNPDAVPGSIEYKGVIESLWDIFGGTINSKNYKVLSSKIGAIYGDGIYYERAEEILKLLAKKGFASGTITLGPGSYFYQGDATRDSLGSAIKATAAVVDGDQVDILKDPITDDGTKKSATGRLAVLNKANGDMYLVEKATPEQEAKSLLQPVWENGEFIRFQSFYNVRETLKRSTAIRMRRLSKDY